jgi:hypothetical protein
LQKVPVRPLDLANPECELRRLLLGSGLVAESADLKWLLNHVDLALPFPAVKFLDSILGETNQGVTTVPDGFDRLLKEFLATTDSFADFDEHLRFKCPVPGGTDRVAEVLGKISLNACNEGATEAEVKNILSSADSHEATKLASWLFDTFPVKSEGGRVRFASRLFREWWLSQIAEEGGRNA